MMSLLSFLILLVFLSGIYFYAKTADPSYYEGLTNNNGLRCPNILIQKGAKFYLYNSKVAKVPGVNPVEFDNLEEYTEFLDWQRSQGIRCPVLYLQQSYDAQGNEIYKSRPGVSEQQGGLPPSGPVYPNPTLLVDATQNDPSYNINSYPAHDQTSYYVGTTTPLDKMNQQKENLLYSDDPMDPNWGGIEYTQNLVDQGYYKDNEVSISV
uniref:Uncharacterized protein n=1 Tax=viral metagenome TaxID=1070528 RepID=A0A6C0IEX2_9ZZZZ